MSSRHSFVACLERDDDEIEVTVEYELSPYQPAQGPTYSCGGLPADEAEIELLSVKLDGVAIDFTGEEEERLIEKCWDDACEAEAEERAAYEEYRWEMFRDRALEAR